MASLIEFDTKPGVIAAAAFLLLDLVLLSVLDKLLELGVNACYYRRMRKGKSVHVRSADVPVLTKFLLDKLYLPPNLVAIVLKAAIIVFIFFVNITINTAEVPVTKSVSRNGTFVMNALRYAGYSTTLDTVQRRNYDLINCVTSDGDQLTYYRVAYDLENGVFLQSDVGKLGVNTTGQYRSLDSSRLCTSPDKVTNGQTFARISGCSPVKAGGCGDGTRKTRYGNLKIASKRPFENLGIRFTITEFEQSQVEATWPEYENVQLTCLTRNITEVIPRRCILLSRNGTHTILELYRHVPRRGRTIPTIFATFRPGPVFIGDMPFSHKHCAVVLSKQFNGTKARDWKQLSADFVASSAEYVGLKTSYDVIVSTRTVTVIPVWAAVSTCILVSIGVLCRIFAAILLRRSKLPQLNNVNGLSSIIGREQGGEGSGHAVVSLWTEDGIELRVRHSSTGKGVSFQEGYDIG